MTCELMYYFWCRLFYNFRTHSIELMWYFQDQWRSPWYILIIFTIKRSFLRWNYFPISYEMQVFTPSHQVTAMAGRLNYLFLQNIYILFFLTSKGKKTSWLRLHHLFIMFRVFWSWADSLGWVRCNSWLWGCVSGGWVQMVLSRTGWKTLLLWRWLSSSPGG